MLCSMSQSYPQVADKRFQQTSALSVIAVVTFDDIAVGRQMEPRTASLSC